VASLSTNITDLATSIASAIKITRTLMNGNASDLSALNTTAKSNLVAAINEVNSAVSAASGIDDDTTSTSSTWSSQKITEYVGDELENVEVDLTDLIDDTTPSETTVYSSDKVDDLLAALDLLEIDDEATEATSVWSSQQVSDAIDAAITGLVDGADPALDTLKELADAINDDADFAGTVTAALGNRVRTDTASQGLNSTQQSNARTNIGAASAADLTSLTTAVGTTDPDPSFVDTFEAGLA